MSGRSHRRNQSGKILSQSFGANRANSVTSFSQPFASTSENSYVFRSQDYRSSDHQVSEEEAHLVNSVIRYLFVLDRGKQVINKTRIIKTAIGNGGRNFARIMNKAKVLLSEIFGYRLVELEGNKYILVNEIENELPHIYRTRAEASQQVLLFIVLTHIFMRQQPCSEESLCNFLENMGISCSDNYSHPYFGNVKYLITEVFVAQKYLDKTVVEKSDSTSVEFKWGPRAEHEFSRRAALNFVSQVYDGRAINSWPLQFKACTGKNE